MARLDSTPPQAPKRNDAHIQGEHAAHPVSTGIGATVGGVTGATLGLVVAGPIGEIAGGILGVAAGGWSGSALGNLIDTSKEHEFWRKHHASKHHLLDGLDFDSAEPAYRIGYSRYIHHKGYERSFEEAEPDLRRDYEQHEGIIPWERVSAASRAAWMRVHDAHRVGDALLERRHSFSLNTPPASHSDIEVRAWFIYENSGYQERNALDHWLQAEHEQQAHEAIALQAWFIYEVLGYPQGQALNHWLQAERAQRMLRAAA